MSQVAVEDIKWVAKRFAGLLALAEELESYTKFKNQLAEVEYALTQKLEELTKADKSLSAAENDRKAAAMAAADILNEAETEASELVAKAEEDAAKLLQDAKVSVGSMKAAATSELNKLAAEQDKFRKLIAEAEKKVKAANDEYEAVKIKIAKLKDSLNVSD